MYSNTIGAGSDSGAAGGSSACCVSKAARVPCRRRHEETTIDDAFPPQHSTQSQTQSVSKRLHFHIVALSVASPCWSSAKMRSLNYTLTGTGEAVISSARR